MFRLVVKLAAVALVVSIGLLVDASPAAAMCEGARVCEGFGDADHSGLTVGFNGDGSVGTSGGDSNCVYQNSQPGLPVTDPDEGGSRFILDDVLSVFVTWDCDGDGSPDEQGIFVEVVDLGVLAIGALDNVAWPELAIEIPFREKDVVSGFSTPLLLLDGAAGTTFETAFSATAQDAGVVVTATATAQVVNWDVGDINADLGYPGEEEFECDTFGDPRWNTETYTNPCFMRWRGSSAGQPNDRITLAATVVYDIEYEISLFPGEFILGPPTFELDFERPDFPVSEIHVVNTSGSSDS